MVGAVWDGTEDHGDDVFCNSVLIGVRVLHGAVWKCCVWFAGVENERESLTFACLFQIYNSGRCEAALTCAAGASHISQSREQLRLSWQRK